jgi:epoxyqueuosine reductase
MSSEPGHAVPRGGAPLRAEEIKALALELGADDAGVAPAAPVTARELFMSWLARGYAGEMDYLHRYSDVRFDPSRLLPGARSVVVLGLNYFPTRDDFERRGSPLKVASYAWGEDYHRVLRRILRALRRRIMRIVPGLRGRICVDTAPFPDKYWAAMAGLGWQGKHTNVVSRRFGSWLLLGSLVIDAEFDRYDEPHADFCGRCRACLDACPTDAFPAPYLLDARRCISYWTIESRAPAFPLDIAPRLDGWVFGCDICLDVCPWNKYQRPRAHHALKRREGVSLLESGHAADMPAGEFTTSYAGTAVSRARPTDMVRNIRAALESANRS